MKHHPAYLKAAAGQHLTTADLAGLIRSALKAQFPGCKFSVTSKSYAGGSSINIGWTDGPTVAEVGRAASGYKTKSFDGMIDMAHTASLWLAPDGSATLAHDFGTTGSGGTHPEVINDPHHPDAVLVDSLSHPYVFTRRQLSAEMVARAARELLDRYHVQEPVDCMEIAAQWKRGDLLNRVAPWCDGPITRGINDWACWETWLNKHLSGMSDVTSPISLI
jgi:hypothetical protein